MQEKPKRKQIFKERPWIYRHPTLFVYIATFVGTCYTLSPLIYALTASEESQKSLRLRMGLKVSD